MELKKSPKANLENKKTLFTEIGLALSLAVVLCAFEYRTTEKAVSTLEEDTFVPIEEEIIPITQETPPPKQDMPKIPQLSDEINIVSDDIQVEDIIINTEDIADMGVQVMDYVAEVVEEEIVEEAIPFAIVEEKPSFQGGDANTFNKWVQSRLVYPEIALENGCVHFTPLHNKDTYVLTPGQLLTYHVDEQQITTEETDISIYTSWKNGIYSFRQTPLSAIMNDLSRWYNIPISFAKKELENITFTGEVKRYDNFIDIAGMFELTKK